MDYHLNLNWQEDELAPRGTTYFAEILKKDCTSLGEMDGTSWQDAIIKMIAYLQETGEI